MSAARAAAVPDPSMLRYEAQSTADPAAAWALLARPARWQEWAPHVRGAWGLGEGEVRRGAVGAARLLGVVPVPARVVDVSTRPPVRSWSWRVGPVLMDHRVTARPGGGCTIGVDLAARPAVEALLRASYGPVVATLVRRLARVAER
jgi:hypothetical protein